jgi:hypothetical protein
MEPLLIGYRDIHYIPLLWRRGRLQVAKKNASIDNYLYMFWIYLDMIYGDIGPPHEQGMATKVALHCCGGRDGRRMSLNVNQKKCNLGILTKLN